MEKARSLINDKNARAFLIGQSLSFVASAAMPIVVTFAILDAHYPATSVAEVLAAIDMPFVLLLLIGGAIADRFSRRRAAISAEFARAIVTLAIAYVLNTQHYTPLQLGLLGIVWGISRAFFAPTLIGMTSEIFEVNALVSANSFREGALSIGNLAGPVLGGLGITFIGSSATMAILACLYAASALWLLTLKFESISNTAPGSVWFDLKMGFRDIISQKWCWIGIAVYTIMHLLVFGPIVVLGPLIANHFFGGASIWGILVGFQGAGGITGAFLASKINLRRPLWTSSIIVLCGAPALFLLGLHQTPLIIAPALMVLGAGFAFIGINWETALQHNFPIESLSRVSSFDIFGSLALYPLGQILGGFSTKYISITSAVQLCGLSLVSLIINKVGN